MFNKSEILPFLTLVFFLASASHSASPRRVIFDHDGAFEDYIALSALAAKSMQPNSPVKLIAVTTMAHGESYCPNSSGYPEFKESLLNAAGLTLAESDQGTIDGITKKVLSAAKLNIPIYSGCGEEVANVQFKNEDPVLSPPLGYGDGKFNVQLTLAGMDHQGPCYLHQEKNFRNPDVVCWIEFSRAFRDETLDLVLPGVQSVLADYKLNEIGKVYESSASKYLADEICRAYSTKNNLTVVSVGPATNLARAYSKIAENGCGKEKGPFSLAKLNGVLETYFMGGVLDTVLTDNFDTEGRYRLNEQDPFWAPGNVYFQDQLYTFDSHHVPFGATDIFGLATLGHHKDIFNSTNSAEFNFWVDPQAVDVILNSGVKTRIVPLNATNNSKIDPDPFDDYEPIFNENNEIVGETYFPERDHSFAKLIDDNDGPGERCDNGPAQVVKRIIMSHPFHVFDTLNFWDTTTLFSLWDTGSDSSRVAFSDRPGLEITYANGVTGLQPSINGNLNTCVGDNAPTLCDVTISDPFIGNSVPLSITPAELFRRDNANLFDGDANNPFVKIALETVPADQTGFTVAFHQELFEVLCPQKQK